MLLETLDIKKNDIIIFSQNIFNLERNFKIIFKDKKDRKAYNISYSEVCKQINEYSPKNIIVYRLLTNFRNLTLENIKYGFLVYINGVKELIYFDPVYAVKELEGMFKEGDLSDMRFRIQQVGLTTLNRKNNLPNYAEIYSIDLEATEAKFQNDRVFADAIYSFAIEGDYKKRARPEGKKEDVKETTHEQKPIAHDIAEDTSYDFKQVKKLNYGKTLTKEIIDEEGKKVRTSTTEDEAQPDVVIPSAFASDEPKGAKSLSELINSKKAKAKTGEEALEKLVKTQAHLLDIFKSSESLKKYMMEKEDKRVVLKLKKK